MTITFTALAAGSSEGALQLGLTMRGYGAGLSDAYGRTTFALKMRGSSYSSAALETPVVPAHGLLSLALSMSGQSYSTGVGAGELQLGLALRGYGGDAQGGGRLRLGMTLDGAAVAAAGAYGLMVDRPAVISGVGGLWVENLRENVHTISVNSALPIAVLGSAIAAAGNLTSNASVGVTVEEEVVFGEALALVWQMLVEEGITTSATATGDAQKIVKVVSRLLLSGEVDTYAEAVVAVTVGLVFGSMVEVMAMETITDQIQLNALLTEMYTAVERMLDGIIAAAAVSPSHLAVMLVDEKLVLGDSVATAAELSEKITESVGFFMTLNLDDGQYIAWVLNTESKGLTRYTNYPFNSFMEVGGRYYGVTSTYLYRLDGDDDAGTPISAKLRLGLSSLGTRKLKRIPEGYVGYTSDGTLWLQVITSDETTGEKVGAYYKLAPRAAGAVRENRWKIGKGLKSVDWDFEITNVDGADFDISAIQWRPLILDRRTRG